MATRSIKWKRGLLVSAVALQAIAASGCGGPGTVQFDRDRCYVDGRPATLTQVEEREALVQHRIAVRQPWLVVITVVVVSLAGIGYIEKLVLLLSASRDTKGMGERMRAVAERYRAHRVRYFAMVGGSVALLVTAGILYIWVDADKRANERTLGTLQFCHLALRTSEETSALNEQRQNLASIHETAGEIRQIIDKLPPAEQVKAQEIIGHMDDAVGRERRLITEGLERSQDTADAIRDGTLSIEKNLSGVQSALGALKDVPASVKAVVETLQKADQRGTALQSQVTELAAAVQSLQHTADGIASRPPPACPACVCNERPQVASADPVSPPTEQSGKAHKGHDVPPATAPQSTPGEAGAKHPAAE
ncbi:MAG TPA: hypothetical protein VHO67_22355 [Polyangia bacterium]|nr:hypothetical protein [Polyangia bacterium]